MSENSYPSFQLRNLTYDVGIYTDITSKAALGKYVAGNKVRFRNRFPESMGGCSKYDASLTWNGVPRDGVTWETSSDNIAVGIGTHKGVEIEINGTKTDVTPLRYLVTGTLGANPFTTSSGNATVSVAHTAHGRAVGDVVDFPNAPTLDGVDLSAFAWEVTTITDPDNYVITTIYEATGTTAGGGGSNVQFRYNSVIIGTNPIGTVDGSTTVTVSHTAHGLTVGSTAIITGATSINSVVANGSWVVTGVPNANSYTFTYTAPASGTGSGGGTGVRVQYVENIGDASGVDMRLPSLVPWGVDLLFTLGRNSSIYRWDAANPTDRARHVPRAPTCNFISLNPDDQSLIAYGANQDDLSIAWSDQEDYTTWEATSQTTADERRILRGSTLVAACAIPGGTLVATDIAIHLMTFIGGDFVFSITYIGKTSVAGQNAMIEKDGIAYWMGIGNFYMYDGRLSAMPCSCYRHVFKNISATEMRGVYAGTNAAFNEIVFFYASSTATYNDSYICFNHEESCWYPGTWDRTIWLDADIINVPLAASPTGILFNHETGTQDDEDPLGAQIDGGEVEIAPDMPEIMHCQRIVVDVIMTGNVYLSAKFRDTRADSYYVAGPILITEDTKEIWIRGRGRRMALSWATPTAELEELATETDLTDFITTEDGETILLDGVLKDQTTNLATTWRIGVNMADVMPDGYR